MAMEISDEHAEFINVFVDKLKAKVGMSVVDLLHAETEKELLMRRITALEIKVNELEAKLVKDAVIPQPPAEHTEETLFEAEPYFDDVRDNTGMSYKEYVQSLETAPSEVDPTVVNAVLGLSS